MALYIFNRLIAYLFPLSILTVGFYSMRSQSVILVYTQLYNRRIPCPTRDPDLPVSPRRCSQFTQIGRACLWEIVA